MTFPQHQDPAKGNEATAPYNFVPLPDKIETLALNDLPNHNSYDTARHTGRIEVKLTTDSPLYIRSGMSPELFAKIGKEPFNRLSPDEKQQVAQFFHTHTNPVIPGSSLRGMLRSMVEIVSYGKVQPVSDKQLVYRAVGDRTSLGDFYRDQLLGKNKGGKGMRFDYPSPNVRGGYLARDVDGNWAIRPAQTHLGETFVHVDYKDADGVVGSTHGRQIVHNVFVEPARRLQTQRSRKSLYLDLALTNSVSRTQAQSSMVPAKLIESGQMGNPAKSPGKHMHCAIYEPDTTKSLIEIPPKIWAIYEEDRDLNRGLETRKLQNVGDPLFYLVDHKGKLVFFGPTMMFRLPYTQSPEDLGPKDLVQDIKETDIDFAEAMFGYVKKIETKITKEKTYASRIFVGDARLAQDAHDIWLNNGPITPKILSGPKPTSFQLYLTQQDPHNNKKLDHYAPTSPHKTVIRGHKLYWHKGPDPAIAHPDPANAPEKQITQISPLKPGVSFTFAIRFENLSDLELGALWWILRLGADENYRLKLGMGKPLGMGAIKTEPILHLTNRQTRYQSLFNGDNWQIGVAGNDNTQADKLADAFKDFIKKDHTDAFGGDGRINQLLALLNWQGPNPNETEYMTDLKAFSRDRKVLPTPIGVLQQSGSNNNRTRNDHNRGETHTSSPPDSGKRKPPDIPPAPQKITYANNFVFKATLTGEWDKKIKGLKIAMPNGDEGHLTKRSRKQINKELGNSLELIVVDYNNGVYILDFH